MEERLMRMLERSRAMAAMVDAVSKLEPDGLIQYHELSEISGWQVETVKRRLSDLHRKLRNSGINTATVRGIGIRRVAPKHATDDLYRPRRLKAVKNLRVLVTHCSNDLNDPTTSDEDKEVAREYRRSAGEAVAAMDLKGIQRRILAPVEYVPKLPEYCNEKGRTET